jgi:phenylpyruvate tautomerase PptA (4-oxalocrotonate tautomerase family)
MPLVRIEIVKGRTTVDKKQLLEGVHAALVEAFEIPDDDRTQRLIEHDPSNFEIPPGGGERYTLIEITAFPGRSATAKRRLYEAIVRNLEAGGVRASDISVVLHEPPLENWGIRGGRPASDVDLGFRVDV